MPKYSDHQLRLASKLYYEDGLSQTEVSRYVNVSQAHVSRLLSLAQERGIVRIFVDDYEPRDAKMEKTLKERFGLSAVAVVKSYRDLPAETLRLTVARFAAKFVASLVPDGGTLSISGGRTLRELMRQLPPGNRNLTGVFQSMGNLESNITTDDAQELGRVLAVHYGAPFHALSSPAYMRDKESRDSFLQLDQIRGMWNRFAKVDLALIGVGNMEDSIFIERGVLTKKDLQDLRAAGAIGEICGRFFDHKGKECATPWRDRVVSMEFSHLRRTPDVMAIVSGPRRSVALRAAILGGLIKSLAIDQTGAEELLAEP
jgi:DNA-binding transcriptional regulator LsrR (DeoR family)